MRVSQREGASPECADEDGSYLTDPEQLHDQLPQPFRMIDKVLERLLERAWGVITEREAARAARQAEEKTPLLRASGQVKLPVSTNCLTCTDDGKYIFMGHFCGISVISAQSQHGVSTWHAEGVEVTFLHCIPLGEATYLIATVDDMGVSRLFAFYAECIYLIKAINETDDVNQRTNCTKFELSRGGDYAAVVIEWCRESWLEIYRLPKELWLKELEGFQATAVKQMEDTPGTEDIKFSPLGMVLKIKAPKTISGTILKSPFDVLQKTEEGNVIGSGQNHMISDWQLDRQSAVFKCVFRKHLDMNAAGKKGKEQPSQCTFHFLLAGGLCPFVSEGAEGGACAICLWWSSDHNLFQYILHKKPKDKADGEPRPDTVWPNAQEIVCSAISRCTQYIALGLAGGIFTLWDRQFRLPCRVLSLSPHDDISRLLFMDSAGPCASAGPPPPLLGTCHSTLSVLVTCRSGVCLSVKAGRGVDPQVTTLTDRGLPAVILSVHFLQSLALFLYRDGTMLLQDSCDGAAMCSLLLPQSHVLASPWNPVFVLDPVNCNLLVRGDRVDSDEDGGSCLFVFSLYQYSGKGASGPALHVPQTVDEVCHLYLQERARTLRERNETVAKSWKELQQRSSAAL